MPYKRLKCTAVLSLLLLLCACGQTPDPEQLVRWMAVSAGSDGFAVSLANDSDEAIAQGKGISFAAAWAEAEEGLPQAPTYGLMDTVLVGEGMGFCQLKAVAEGLQDSGKRFPQISFWQAEPEQAGGALLDQRKASVRCDLNQLLAARHCMVLPALLRQDQVLVCQQEGDTLPMYGFAAETAKLLSGQSRSIQTELTLHSGSRVQFSSGWVLCSVTPQESGKSTIRWECFACKAKCLDTGKTLEGAAQQELAALLQQQAEQALSQGLLGREPSFAASWLSRAQDPAAPPEALTLSAEVRLHF